MAAIVIPLVRPVALPGISGIEAGAATAETGIAIGRLSGGLTEHSGTAWMRVLLWIYIAGAAVALVRLVWAYARLTVILSCCFGQQKLLPIQLAGVCSG